VEPRRTRPLSTGALPTLDTDRRCRIRLTRDKNDNNRGVVAVTHTPSSVDHSELLRAAGNSALVSVALIGAGIFAAYITPAGLRWPRLHWPQLLALYAICWAGCFWYQRRWRH